MRSIRRFLRRIRLRHIALVFFAFIAMFVLAIVINLSLPDNQGSLYGTRLEGIDNYPIESTKIDAIKAEVTDNKNIKTVEYILKGKIINFIINLEKDIDVEDAESFSAVILKNLTDEQKSFYDVQIFVTSLEDTDLYPIIGYKHNTSEDFSWNNQSVDSE
jgi:hypothetical protein